MRFDIALYRTVINKFAELINGVKAFAVIMANDVGGIIAEVLKVKMNTLSRFLRFVENGTY